MQFIQTIYTIWQREIIRYWRDKTRIISTLFQPLMFLVIFGAGLSKTLATGNFGVDFTQFMYPGIIAMSVMSVAFFSTISTVWDREFGFLKEILVAPVSRVAVAFGKTLGATTIASIQALILLILAPLIGVAIHIAIIPQLVIFMLLLAFAISGMGLLISSLMKTTESFGLVMQVLIFPMFFISGAFFPLTAVPSWMRALSYINPLTYGVDAMRQILLGDQVASNILNGLSLHAISVNALFLVAFSSVMVSAAVWAFNKRA
ncbi:MAG: ABC transporter [Candidatus Harrisonbacteria bacterium CG10_big_fil_rev_8_21_14_0_10_49_15]|uniref:Transport permease protein n=1 Tax=Candidatus Harrisonbacteria bacterium CG10_big_fil_rev_8_21_14_0_10_49_15 TaxID=1974587 RepID=A0A2H0UK88_9BACT|nr:MAG: ABC transporter [Candidatus Harrisonbacteria bacterium CG10_big_fil_rev_8_21_14_0_10_49_15]